MSHKGEKHTVWNTTGEEHQRLRQEADAKTDEWIKQSWISRGKTEWLQEKYPEEFGKPGEPFGPPGTINRTEEAIDFHPQQFLMEHIEKYASYAGTYNDRYRHVIPIVEDTPASINHTFLGAPGVKPFLDIDAKTFAQITPKIDLYKVVYPDEESKGIEINIPFNKSHTKDDKDRIFANQFSRGIGAGIVSFDWELKGKDHAQAKTAIQARLKLFLKSVPELDYPRATSKDGKHTVRYLDLIYRERQYGEGEGEMDGDIYNPDYFLLKVSVGWRSNKNLPKKLREALEKCQTTMYLSLWKHEMDFNDDGSIILTIDYFGYVSSLLANTNILNLTSNSTIGFVRGTTYDLTFYQSIIKNMLFDSRRIFGTTIVKRQNMNQSSELMSVEYEDVGPNYDFYHGLSEEAGMSAVGTRTEEKSEEDVRESIASVAKGKAGYQLKYFYLGDLIDTVLTFAYNDNPKFSRFRFLAGPVIIENLWGEKLLINLCDIPISLDLYYIFFQNHIIDQKYEELSVSTFLQKVFSKLVVMALQSIPGPRKHKVPALSFKYFSLPELEPDVDPIFNSVDASSNGPFQFHRVKLGENEKKVIAESHKASDKKYFHYALMSSANPREFYRKHGNGIPEEEDSKDGIYYLSTGKRKNIVRSVKFTKQDVPFMDQANMERAGMRETVLRGLYNAEVVMEGAPIFRPGVIVFIDGATMSGDSIVNAGAGAGNVGSLNSLSKRLGFGGYYVVTEVEHTISSGEFETRLKCTWLSFGDVPIDVKVVSSVPRPYLEHSPSALDMHQQEVAAHQSLPR